MKAQLLTVPVIAFFFKGLFPRGFHLWLFLSSVTIYRPCRKREFQLRLKWKKATFEEFGKMLPLGVKCTVQGSGIVGTMALESSLTSLESFPALRWASPNLTSVDNLPLH